MLLEKFEFLKPKDITQINLMSSHEIELLSMSMDLHKNKKIPPSLANVYLKFMNLINRLKKSNSFDLDSPFILAYDSRYELTLYTRAEGNVILNYGHIDEFPPKQINLVFSNFMYFLGYYVAVKNLNRIKSHIYDVALLFISIFQQIFGASHAILTFSDRRIDIMKLILAAHIYKKFMNPDNLGRYIPQIRSSLKLHNAGDFVINWENEKFKTITGTFEILKEQNIINVSKDVFVYKLYNYFSPTGLVMFDNWYRFCAMILSTMYPSSYSNSYIRKLNRTAYSLIFNTLYKLAVEIDDFDNYFLRE